MKKTNDILKVNTQRNKTIPQATITQSDIERMIITIRNVQVILDRDLAILYQVEVKQMNRQVKRNIERFPDDFMFQLTKEEYDRLKCQFGTSNSRGGDRRALPYAFTQQGIAMLSGLLRSKVAIDTNINIMRAFVNMRHLLFSNVQILQRLEIVEQNQGNLLSWKKSTQNSIEQILNKIENQEPKQTHEQLFKTGCVWDAWSFVSDLVRSANTRIILIDNYVDDRVLTMLDKRGNNVTASIYSRYSKNFDIDLQKHNAQNRKIDFNQLSQKNHDRFLIIDDATYLLGASVKDMGVGSCAITKMEASPEDVLKLITR